MLFFAERIPISLSLYHIKSTYFRKNILRAFFCCFNKVCKSFYVRFESSFTGRIFINLQLSPVSEILFHYLDVFMVFFASFGFAVKGIYLCHLQDPAIIHFLPYGAAFLNFPGDQ